MWTCTRESRQERQSLLCFEYLTQRMKTNRNIKRKLYTKKINIQVVFCCIFEFQNFFFGNTSELYTAVIKVISVLQSFVQFFLDQVRFYTRNSQNRFNFL